jgi:hypothetical protein
MFQNLKSLIHPTPAAETRVRILRDTLIAGRPVSAEQVLTVSERIAGELVSAGAAETLDINEARQNEAQRLASMVPPAVMPNPPPDLLADMPACFAKWWNLNAAGIALENRAIDIFNALIVHGKKGMLEFTVNDAVKNLDMQASGVRDAAFAAIARAVHVGAPTDSFVTELRHLRDALQRAEQATRDWADMNRNELAKLHFECSQHAIAKHGELTRAIRELHGLGFELFNCRIGALQLGQPQARRLYHGSRDYQLYGAMPEPGIQNLRLAWSDSGNDPQHYLQNTPPVMAQMIRDWQVIGEEVSQLTKQAKSELSKARKVAQAA